MPNPLDGVLPYFPVPLRRSLAILPLTVRQQLEEIRLRLHRPVMVVAGGWDAFLGSNGLVTTMSDALVLGEREASQFLETISRASLYAMEDDIRQGFITLPGGHRVGLTGQAVMEQQRLRTLKNIAGFNVRLARAVPGAANSVLPRLVRQGRVMHTLIASAPGCGKTTMLRDLTRQLSSGVQELGVSGMRVAVADERSEIAACWRGVPQLDLGPRTDVLDGCPKAEAIMLLLRSMSPQVIVTDEIGNEADTAALEEALYSGVTLLATAHGATLEEVLRRPTLARLLRKGAFERVVILSRSRGPGTVEEIVNLRATLDDSRSEQSSVRAVG